jgi:hypothetical membrane protein
MVAAHGAVRSKQSIQAGHVKHRLRGVTLVGSLCSILSVAILHIVRNDLNPVTQRLSEYAVGPYGWLMTTAFLSLGCVLLAIAVLLGAAAGSNQIRRAITLLGLVAGAGIIVSGAFPTGVSSISEVVHSRASGIATAAAIAIALVYSLPRMRQATASTRDLVGAALALSAAFLGAISPTLHESQWTGLSQRVLWATVMVWLLWVVVMGRDHTEGAFEESSSAAAQDHEFR